jgi:hypothetical protein
MVRLIQGDQKPITQLWVSVESLSSNFDEEFTREQPTLTPVHGQLSARDQKEFAGFSWVWFKA